MSDNLASDSKRIKLHASDHESLKSEVFEYIDNKISGLTKELTELKQSYRELQEKFHANQHPQDGKPSLPPREIIASSVSLKAAAKPVESANNGSRSNFSENKHTFGGTSFQFKAATPTNSTVDKTDTATPKVVIDKEVATPKDKPVFGSTVSFAERPKSNIFDNLKSTNSPPTFGSTSSFGANSKFNNAFQNSLKKRSFLDVEKSDTNEDHQTTESTPDDQANEEENNDQYKQVDLTPVEKQTGEENEKSHFTAMCKLFELDLGNIAEGWKERGLGSIHLNQSIDNLQQVRLVMRSNGLLRVILNVKITKSTEIFKGLESSLAPGKYMRFNSIKDNKPIQILLKFGNQTLRDELSDKIENLKDQLDN